MNSVELVTYWQIVTIIVTNFRCYILLSLSTTNSYIFLHTEMGLKNKSIERNN